jgi:hypothetical protein
MNVSQLKYWLEKTPTDADSSSQNGAYLSYNVFRILSILGGFFGLDHLYLRSLWTFLAKFIVNILCFGVWWIYDMLHALFNEPVVKMYGLGVPGLGPMGIAAGVLADDTVSGTKHWAFFIYAIALFCGGMFGLDDFLVGNRQSGIIRLICCISIILTPVAFLFWAYNIFQFFTNTENVLSTNHAYFGGTNASWGSGSFFGSLFGFTAINSIASAAESAAKTVELTAQGLSAVGQSATKIVGAIEGASNAIMGVGDNISFTGAAPIVGRALSEINEKKPINEKEKEKENEKENENKKENEKENKKENENENKKENENEKEKEKTKGQEGGGNLNALSYTFIGTLILIVFSGLSLSLSHNGHQSIKNDDSPPQFTQSTPTPFTASNRIPDDTPPQSRVSGKVA